MTTETPYEDTSSLDDFINTPTTPPAEPVATEPEVPAEETPAPAPATDEPAPEPTPEESEKKKSANRFTAQTRALREAERRIAELETKLKAPEPAPVLTEQPKTGNVPASEAPDPAKYQYGELDPQFMRDTAKYEAQALFATFQENLRKENEAQQQAQAAQREVAALREKATAIEAAGRAKFDDFDEVVMSGTLAGIPKEAAQLIAESDLAADAFYHLASNPEEAAQVFGGSVLQQARWLAKFEAQATAPPPPKLPKAPAPLSNPIRGSSGRFTTPDDTDDLDAFSRKFYQRG